MVSKPYRILIGDCRKRLADIPAGSVQCVVTSPPYWGLRDYQTGEWEGGDAECDHLQPMVENSSSTLKMDGRPLDKTGHRNYDKEIRKVPYRDVCKCGAKRVDDQIGLEASIEEYVATMVEVFRGVWRVLRDDGTVWLNLGDGYCNAGSRNQGTGLDGKRRGGVSDTDGTWKDAKKTYRDIRHKLKDQGIKHKDLIGMPWRVAFALQADGWYLRSDVIWCKPNPMPESCTDRPTKAHEYLFLLTKQPRYFYDAEAIREKANSADRVQPTPEDRTVRPNDTSWHDNRYAPGASGYGVDQAGRNKRSVWTIPTQPNPEAHFATFPEKLVRPCILAGTSKKGCCRKCGTPWRRVTEKIRRPTRPGETSKVFKTPDGWDTAEGGHGTIHREGREKGRTGYVHKEFRDDKEIGNRDPERHVTETKTIGWVPGCECCPPLVGGQSMADAGYAPVPCIVLDPFAGTFTAVAVAVQLGRRGIGIELNPEYVEMGKKKLKKAVGKIGFGVAR